MKKITCLRFLMVMLCCCVAVSAIANQMYIMVDKAELHSEPDINSPIVGYVYKSDTPKSCNLNKDGSWAQMQASDAATEGWVMTCVCKEGNNESYGFDYETCYKINKEWAKGEISQEVFAEKLSNLQNNLPVDEEVEEFCDIEEDGSMDYAQENSWVSRNFLIIAIIALWIVSLISFVLSLSPSARVLKHTGLYILLLGACEILFVLHPDAPTSLRTGRMIEILVLVVGQLLMIAIRVTSARNAFEKLSMRVGALMLFAAIGIFIYNIGVGNFLWSVVEAIIGIILLIIVGAVVVMAIKAPPSKKRKDEGPEENKYETCGYCRYFDNGEGFCHYHRANRSSGDSCGYFKS